MIWSPGKIMLELDSITKGVDERGIKGVGRERRMEVEGEGKVWRQGRKMTSP